VLAALLLAQAVTVAPTVGVVLAVDDPGARAVLRGALEEALRPGPVVWSCREATLCLEVTALPVTLGKTVSGWAVACRVARRLAASPDWPAEVPRQELPEGRQSAVEIIEDTTASGELACAPCEEEKQALRLKLAALREFAAGRLEEVGGLGLWVGPAQDSFLRQVAASAASEVRKLLQGGAP